MGSSESAGGLRYDENKGLACSITFVCQVCTADLRRLDALPSPFGSWGCVGCKRVFHYGAAGWQEVTHGTTRHIGRRR
jgi:hypothetical protein